MTRERRRTAVPFYHGGTKIAAPAAERDLFEKPLDFRHAVPQLSDRFTVHGASYVRPPIQPIPIDRAFEKMDSFAWRGREIWCAKTAGNSPGSMSYLLRQGREGDAKAGWLGIKGVDAILVTHMHGDHFLDAEHVRKNRGCEIWTHERVVDLLERATSRA